MKTYSISLNSFFIFLLLVDSGGTLGVRNFAFLIIFSNLLNCIFFKKIQFNIIFLKTYSIFISSLIIPIAVSINNNIPFNEIFPWISVFLIVPFFPTFIKSSSFTNNDFITAGKYFALLIILLFVIKFFQISSLEFIFDYFRENSQGFFKDKYFLSGDILPNVYFQGTLGLIICGCLAIYNKNYITVLIIAISLILAPSRFGFVIIFLSFFIVNFKFTFNNIFILGLLIVILTFLLSLLPFGYELFSIYTGESDGVSVRSGHFTSLIVEYEKKPISLILGQGPGSTFYSQGINEITNNIEVSQLELLRKYGLITFFLFHIFYFYPIITQIPGSLKISLLLFYVVTFSNPVLLSIFSLFFLSYTYSSYTRLKLING